METSAKIAQNVEEAFIKMTMEIYAKVQEESIDVTNEVKWLGHCLCYIKLHLDILWCFDGCLLWKLVTFLTYQFYIPFLFNGAACRRCIRVCNNLHMHIHFTDWFTHVVSSFKPTALRGHVSGFHVLHIHCWFPFPLCAGKRCQGWPTTIAQEWSCKTLDKTNVSV